MTSDGQHLTRHQKPRIGRFLGLLAVAALILGAAAAGGRGPGAGLLPPAAAQTTSSDQRAVYRCAGVPEPFSVPPGVTSLVLEAQGGGGWVRGTLAVTAGDLLTITAGCPDVNGGAATVQLGAESLLVAAGGGGAASAAGARLTDVSMGTAPLLAAGLVRISYHGPPGSAPAQYDCSLRTGKEDYTVPAGASGLAVIAVGGRGGPTFPSDDDTPSVPGASGGAVLAYVDVSPGNVLAVQGGCDALHPDHPGITVRPDRLGGGRQGPTLEEWEGAGKPTNYGSSGGVGYVDGGYGGASGSASGTWAGTGGGGAAGIGLRDPLGSLSPIRDLVVAGGGGGWGGNYGGVRPIDRDNPYARGRGGAGGAESGYDPCTILNSSSCVGHNGIDGAGCHTNSANAAPDSVGCLGGEIGGMPPGRGGGGGGLAKQSGIRFIGSGGGGGGGGLPSGTGGTAGDQDLALGGGGGGGQNYTGPGVTAIHSRLPHLTGTVHITPLWGVDSGCGTAPPPCYDVTTATLKGSGSPAPIATAVPTPSPTPRPSATPSPSPTPAPLRASMTAPLYRLYKHSSGNHVYTTDAAERDTAIQRYGYVSEGIAAYVATTEQPGLVQLYRLYNAALDNHLLTTDKREYDSVQRNGYVADAFVAYISSRLQEGLVQLYRLYNPGLSNHFYTVDRNERDQAVRNGWTDEGSIGYVVPPTSP
jgi:hypothetical protein